jgi:hypothetical protein
VRKGAAGTGEDISLLTILQLPENSIVDRILSL